MAIQQKLKEENTKAEASSSDKKEVHSQYPFYIHEQYVKDLSFENPNALLKYREKNVSPDVSVNVLANVSKINEDTYEVILKLNINSEAKDSTTSKKNTIFLLDLSYGALVSVDKTQPTDVIEPALFVHVPFLMFPFVRELIATITKNGGYPSLLLEPIDFASLYIQKKREAEKNKVEQTPSNSSDTKPTIN